VLEAEAKRQLGTYAHPRGTPTPSPRGQPPAVVTGTLRRSIRVTAPEPTGTAGWSISVGPTAIYGRIQELGGFTGRNGATYLPPRPYMDPALKKVLADDTLANCYLAAWRGAVVF
jgi:phage gpG-like protein